MAALNIPLSRGLRRRLLVLLLLPLAALAAINAWQDYRSAADVARQQDRRLQGLASLLADSVVGAGDGPTDPPLMLMAPALEEFLSAHPGITAYAVLSAEGQLLLGNASMSAALPKGSAPQFVSETWGGVTYRILSQRVKTVAGELVVLLADGSDARQQWLHLIGWKVVLPNLVLMVAAMIAVNGAVRLALRPLTELQEAVACRSPRDLSPLEPQVSPEEVRPLVEAINHLLDTVNQQTQSQRRFVADAAHQLRTPLAGLQAQTEAWAQALELPQYKAHKASVPVADVTQHAITLQADQVLKLRDAVRRTSQLANQLLALSRLDARSALDAPMQELELSKLCESTLEQYVVAAADCGVDLGLDACVTYAQGYAWLLSELLANLVDNAIKYTPAGGHVTVRCGVRPVSFLGDHGAFLEVEDDGPGVPLHEQSRITERFYRGVGAPGQGSGLGLAIAAEIARVHQSVLEISSASTGRGLRVHLGLVVRN